MIDTFNVKNVFFCNFKYESLLMNIEHNLKSLVELESQIKERLKEFQNKRKSNQKNNNFFSLSQIWLAATTTIVIAINTKESFFYLSLIALLTSTLTTISAQMLSKYMYQERLAMNISTICALYELQSKIVMDKKKEEDDICGYKITIQQVELYQERYQQILNIANSQWQTYINEKKEKSE